jgi:hypothetical protein
MTDELLQARAALNQTILELIERGTPADVLLAVLLNIATHWDRLFLH